MEKLIKALEKAMAEDLKTLPWMSEATKVEARKKLDAITTRSAIPTSGRTTPAIEVKRDDLLGNVNRAGNFERKRNLAKFGKPVDPTEWGMTPPTVNAYYNPPQNNINFPAGILQPPFYDNSADAAVNFGGIGVVIGHEMTHGFDDQGSKYDLHGNVRQWWTDEDKKKFKERTECTAKEYDGFSVAPGQNLNGHLTLGENTADNGGIRIAYQALMATLAQPASPAPSRSPGQGHARRLHPGAALLHRLRADLVPEPDRAVGARAGQDRSAQLRRVAREGHRAELRGVRQGVRLQGGPAHDAGERRLPDLVEKRASRVEGQGSRGN